MIPYEIEVEDLSVNIHVAGPGFGEGICIVVGRKIFVGIDCCASLVHPKQGRLSYLDEVCGTLGPDAIYIWIITHFHYDHIQSLSTVLNRLGGKLSYILAPTDYTEADLAFVVGLDAQDVKGNAGVFFLAKSEYERVRVVLLSSSAIVRGGLGALSVASLKLLCGSEDRHLAIEAFGPTVAESAVLVGKAVRSLAEREGLIGKSREAANAGSYVLRLLIEDFEGLFLGDAPAERVEELLAHQRRGAIRPSFLKVSHHGSCDGTSESLLRLMTGGRAICRALIAPFVRHKLPDKSVVALLRDRGFDVKICGEQETDTESDLEVIADYLGVADLSSVEYSPFGREIIVTEFDI